MFFGCCLMSYFQVVQERYQKKEEIMQAIEQD